ncbi:MAG: septal ring lytic transglycosylase RlpA family protein [Actinomycetes bacterium]
MESIKNLRGSFVFVPVLLALTSFGGGAGPGDGGDQDLPVRLSAKRVTWGSAVSVSGVGVGLAAKSPVSIYLVAPGHSMRRIGIAHADRRGRWSASVKPGLSGVIKASAGSLPTATARTSASARIAVSPKAIVAPIPPSRPGSRVRIRGIIRPAGNQRVVLSIRHLGHWKVVSRSRARNGRFTAYLTAPKGVNQLRVAIGAGNGLSNTVVNGGNVSGLRPAGASWYGLYGEGLACGGVLHYNQMGVAHKTLPCGTRVTVSYHGRTVVVPVIDRGPYISGREFDLTGAVARKLHFDGVDTVWVAP